MCGAPRSWQSMIVDPAGLLTNDKTKRFADPLGLTRTAIGDPTGQVRKYAHGEAAVAKAEDNAIKANNADIKRRMAATSPGWGGQYQQATALTPASQGKTILGG